MTVTSAAASGTLRLESPWSRRVSAASRSRVSREQPGTTGRRHPPAVLVAHQRLDRSGPVAAHHGRTSAHDGERPTSDDERGYSSPGTCSSSRTRRGVVSGRADHRELQVALRAHPSSDPSTRARGGGGLRDDAPEAGEERVGRPGVTGATATWAGTRSPASPSTSWTEGLSPASLSVTGRRPRPDVPTPVCRGRPS